MTPFDPFAIVEDPFPAFAAARAAGGVLQGLPSYPDIPSALYLFRHSTVVAALRHPQLMQAPPGAYQAVRQSMVTQRVLALLTQSLLLADPPRHAPIRRLLAPPVSPGRARTLLAGQREEALALAKRLAAQRRFDAVTDLAAPLAVDLLGRLLGLELPPTRELKALTAAMVGAIDIRRGAIPESMNEACRTLEAHYERALAKGAEPGGMAALMLAEVEAGRWPREELMANLVLMSLAGQETVVDAFGNVLRLLDAAPGQRALLERDGVDWAAAADELLRLGTSVLYAGTRIAAADLEIEGIAIPAGSAVASVISSAVRDSAACPWGDALRLDQPAVAVPTFGSGPHVCLGQHLARVEMATLLEALFTAAPGWRLDRAALRPRPAVAFRGLLSAPVDLPRAA